MAKLTGYTLEWNAELRSGKVLFNADSDPSAELWIAVSNPADLVTWSALLEAPGWELTGKIVSRTSKSA